MSGYLLVKFYRVILLLGNERVLRLLRGKKNTDKEQDGSAEKGEHQPKQDINIAIPSARAI